MEVFFMKKKRSDIVDDKYTMTREQNLFLVKRNIVDYIWKDANLEGISVTYPDTEAIFDGLAVQGYKVRDIIAINNLKHAWQFVLDTLDYPFDYNYLCKINQIVGGNNLVSNAGYIRQFPVKIGGTSWQPDIPIESEIKYDIEEIKKIQNVTDRAISLMLYGMRKQMFLDGNKRTSMLVANQILISNGAGVIAVPVEKKHEFLQLLVEFYETNHVNAIKNFIYEECLDGMNFSNQIEQKEIKLSREGLIINDIKQNGFQATPELIQNILNLEKEKGEEYTIKKIKKSYIKKENSTDETLLDKIVEELKKQEIARYGSLSNQFNIEL